MDFMDDEELTSILSEVFPDTFLYSTPSFTNAPITPSTTLLCTQQPPRLFPNPKTNFSIDSSSYVLNFEQPTEKPKPTKKPRKTKKVAKKVISEPMIIRNQASNTEEDASKEEVLDKKGSRRRSEYDHIGAERKRREQLNQLFITLSAIVPGLKKMDKTSVLGDAITYLKNLQEKVKILEEQTATERIESVVLVKKPQQITIDGNNDNDALPEVEARVCDKTILLNIICTKRKGLLVKLLGEVEKLHLSIKNTTFLPFGNMALHITIVTEMEEEFNGSVKDLVGAIHFALQGYA